MTFVLHYMAPEPRGQRGQRQPRTQGSLCVAAENPGYEVGATLTAHVVQTVRGAASECFLTELHFEIGALFSGIGIYNYF
jgi:hypothetical protein